MGILSRLQVWEFRNLRHLDLRLGSGITLLVGSNGQGKSNILEAVCYLGLLRSFRAQGIAQLKHWGAEAFSVRGQISGTDPADKVGLAVTQSDRRLLQVNGNPVDKASDFINRFICVALVPEDMAMIKGPAAVRRRFLDISISQRWPQYVTDLQGYRAAVASRNLVLRNAAVYPQGVLGAYEDQVQRHGARIEVARRQYAADVGGELARISADLLGGDAAGLTIAYACPGVPKEAAEGGEEAIAAAIGSALRRSRERDQRDGHTSVGPHRADLAVTLGGRVLSAYGSEGECRLACLALRLSSLAIARQAMAGGRAVVALVDDVFGELDPCRRQAFFAAVGQADQVLVTATALPAELSMTGSTAYRVSNGTIAPL